MSGLLARRARRRGGFNPQTSITWHSLFWAEGTDFVALGLADGAAVSTWPNETGETDATQGTAGLQPAYDDVNASFNNQPTVKFDADWVSTAAFGVNPGYPISIVIVGAYTATTATRFFVDGQAGGRNAIYGGTTASTYRLFAGTESANINGRTTSPVVLVATFDGSTGNETLSIDGAAAAFSGNVGAGTLSDLNIGRPTGGTAATNMMIGDIALLGIYSGTITSDGQWSAFKDWITDHYGITLS